MRIGNAELCGAMGGPAKWVQVIIAVAAMTALAAGGQRPILTAAETNGTYRDGTNEIKVFFLGHGKLKVQFALVRARQSSFGPTVNLGDAAGKATIKNDVAAFVPESAGQCRITMFLPGHKLEVVQEGGECLFGHNMRADRTYQRVSRRKPKFNDL